MIYELAPLEINLPVQSGTYSVTVSLKAHCETMFSLHEATEGFITEDCEIYENETRDITFDVTAKDIISIKIYCDGRITATAMAEYVN